MFNRQPKPQFFGIPAELHDELRTDRDRRQLQTLRTRLADVCFRRYYGHRASPETVSSRDPERRSRNVRFSAAVGRKRTLARATKPICVSWLAFLLSAERGGCGDEQGQELRSLRG